jgi:hypothetical protein
MRARAVLAVLLGGVLLGGCTLVPTDATPQSVPARDVPSGLLSGQPVARTAEVTLYYRTSDGAVVARSSTLAAPVGLRIVVAALAVAPADLQTDVPANLTILRGIIHGTTTEITVADDLSASTVRRGLEQIRRTCATLYGTSTLEITSAASLHTYVVEGTPSGR